MKRPYFREIALLLAPMLIILGVALFLQIRKTRATFIHSSTPVHAAFFGSKDEIVSVGFPTPPSGTRGQWEPVFARFNAKSGEKIAEVKQRGVVWAPTLSPDGRWLASLFQGDGNHDFLSLREVQNGFYERAPIDIGIGPAPRLVWKPDSSGLYLLRKDSTTFVGLNDFVVQPQNGWKRVFGNRFPLDAAFSPDGKFVAFSSAWRPLQKPNRYRRGAKTTAGYHDEKIRVCSWPDLKVVATLPGDGFGPPTFTNDGRSLLATLCFKDGHTVVSAHIARLDLRTLKIRFVKIEADSLAALPYARFSPDGRIMVAGGQRVELFYSAASGRAVGQTRELKAAPRSYLRDSGHFSRDGRRYLSACPDGIEIHDLKRMLP